MNYWFRVKNKGWLAVPVSWKGWVVLAVYAAALYVVFQRLETGSPSASATIFKFAPRFLFATLILLLIVRVTAVRVEDRFANDRDR